jgi:hypothetical protein
MAWLLHRQRTTPAENDATMPSDNIGKKRDTGQDAEVPAELDKREAQDRPKSDAGSGGARSPVDSMHVDAPKKQDNARGHRQSQ